MRVKLIPIVTALALLCTGCSGNFLPQSQDIAHTEIMQTLAVDRASNGLYTVTAAGGVRSGDQGSDSQPPVVLSASGVTIANACLTIELAGDSNISYSHVLECLIGEDTARESVWPLVDYMERDYETRMNAKVFVTEGMTAKELIDAATQEQTAVTDRLEAIARDVPMKESDWPYTLNMLLQDLSDNGAALLPVLYLDESGENPEVCPGGLAWFKDGAMRGILSKPLSRAAWLLQNAPENSIFEVELPEGGAASLRLTSVKRTLSPKWENGTLTGLAVNLKIGVALADLQSDQRHTQGTELLPTLEGTISDYLEQGMGEVIALSQQEGADFFHLSREIAVQSAPHKAALNAHWEEWFPKLPVEVQVETTVERSYDTSLP